jgi:hypothetical protein
MRSLPTLGLIFGITICFGQTNTFPTSGSVGIGTTTPAYKLDVTGASDEFKARFQGPDGYILIGPGNSGWAHIYTDRPNFIFNQNVWSITGGFSSYSAANLVLQTNGTSRLTILNSNGNVGIGTATPTSKLHVSSTGTVEMQVSSDGATTSRSIYSLTRASSFWNIGMNVNQSNTDDLQFRFNGSTYPFTIQSGGNVGIGTTSPDAKLSVKGQIHAQEVKVDLNGSVAPDYVFDKDYKLPSLEEIQPYIKANKHLPEVPSAKDMEENGINVGEMNLLLLKKVEELTLYLIETKAAQEADRARVTTLEEEIKKLKQ